MSRNSFRVLCVKCYICVFKCKHLRHSHTTYHNHQGGSSPQKEKPRLLEPKKQ